MCQRQCEDCIHFSACMRLTKLYENPAKIRLEICEEYRNEVDAEKDVNREAIAWMPLPTPYKGDKYTTADNIRSMTDEQLAEFLKSYPGFNHLSYKEVLNWLKIEDGGGC